MIERNQASEDGCQAVGRSLIVIILMTISNPREDGSDRKSATFLIR